MPFYRWLGVRLDATYCKGILFARDQEVLKKNLYAQEIAVLSCKEQKKYYILPICSEQCLFFFQQLHSLLNAGVHVWQALLIISEQTADARLADIILKVADKVQEGFALHEALNCHAVFPSESIHVAQIGAQADNLPVALYMLSNHLQEKEIFKKQLRGVLLLPLCTFIIFIVIALVILLVVIPRYADFFSSMSKELPAMTRILMQASAFIGSYYMIGSLFIVITWVVVLLQLLKKKEVKNKVDRSLLAWPSIGFFIKRYSIVQSMRSLSLLLQGGMSLVPALSIAREAVSNSHLKDQLQDVIEQVRSGKDLSVAMQSKPEFFPQDIILLITLGQETGCMQDMVARIADLYAQQVQRLLQRVTYMVQPALMVVIGLLVAALICAVYMPLFNLADLG